jgi:hypothetical protein
MSRVKTSKLPDIPREVDFRGAERGRYAKRYAEGTNVVLLAPDVAEAFPDSESVNTVLRIVLRASTLAAKRQKGKRRSG